MGPAPPTMGRQPWVKPSRIRAALFVIGALAVLYALTARPNDSPNEIRRECGARGPRGAVKDPHTPHQPHTGAHSPRNSKPKFPGATSRSPTPAPRAEKQASAASSRTADYDFDDLEDAPEPRAPAQEKEEEREEAEQAGPAALRAPPASGVAQQTDDRPYDIFLALSHHKTGTFQLRCIVKAFAEAAGLENPLHACLKDNHATARDMMGCYNWRLKGETPEAPVKRPIFFKSYHGLVQTCEPHGGKGEPWEPCLSFMLYPAQVCDRRAVQNTLRRGSCAPSLPPPPLRIGAFNIVRNPIEAVLSAYSFHTSRPRSEPWLFKPIVVGQLASELQWAGAEADTLARLGLGPDREGEEATYVDLLTALPVEEGVIMEFWHSLPEVVSVARQFVTLASEPGAFSARFEDLRDAYNATVLDVARHLRLGVAPEALVESSVAAGCDPNTWSAAKVAASSHVTVGKKEGEKERAEAALMGYPPARTTLCDLAEALGYEDARCVGEVEAQGLGDDGGSEAARWR